MRGEVRFDAGARAAYASDASNYRQVPIGVVLPRTVEDIVAAVAACREHEVPILARGGGTSLCGQTVNVAVVIDSSKYLADRMKPKGGVLLDYVQVSGTMRRKYIGTGAAYIDVFCGPGRSKIRTNGRFIDGSAVAAFKKANDPVAGFTSIEIWMLMRSCWPASEKRLSHIGAPVQIAKGPAVDAIKQIVSRIDRRGLHFAFLDPHSLGTLSFTLFEEIAKRGTWTFWFMSVWLIYGAMQIDSLRGLRSLR